MRVAKHIIPVTHIESLEAAITGSHRIPTQFGKIAPKGRIGVAQLGSSTLTYGDFQANVSISGLVSEDSLAFGMILNSSGMKVWSDRALPGDIGVVQPGTELIGRHNGLARYAVITVDQKRLHEIAESEGVSLNKDVLKSNDMYRPGEKTGRWQSARMSKELHYLFDATTGDTVENGSEINDDILRIFLRGFVDLELMKVDSSSMDRMGSKLLKQTRELMEAPHKEALSVDLLVKELGVSRRQLFRAFNAHVGMPPSRFLKLYRLSRVRRELVLADPSQVSVSSIALKWDFRELGRFAVEYREIFGESPSQTLRA